MDGSLPYAILIDGGFARAKLGSSRRPLTAVHIIALVDVIHDSLSQVDRLPPLRLHRVYFYDARPIDATVRHPLTGETQNLGRSSLARNNRRLHKELEQVPMLALRYGRLHPRGWVLKQSYVDSAISTGCPTPLRDHDVKFDAGQKGVDMRIGLDIASLTLKRHVSLIVLVTSDSDFVPAMKFARREGAQVCLVRLGHGVTRELREHADIDLDFPAPEVFARCHAILGNVEA